MALSKLLVNSGRRGVVVRPASAALGRETNWSLAESSPCLLGSAHDGWGWVGEGRGDREGERRDTSEDSSFGGRRTRKFISSKTGLSDSREAGNEALSPQLRESYQPRDFSWPPKSFADCTNILLVCRLSGSGGFTLVLSLAIASTILPRL